MGGLLGIVGASNRDDARSRFKSASEKMMRRHCRRASSVETQGGLWNFGEFGSVRLSGPDVGQTLVSEACVLFHGVLHNTAELQQLIDDKFSNGINSQPNLLAGLYAKFGERFVERLHGEFCLAIIDPIRQRVIIASDTIGSYPLYWQHGRQGFGFSSDLSALLLATPSSRRLDLRAVADYLSVGSLLDNRTLVKGLSLLPPGTLLEYDARSDAISIRTYIDIAGFFSKKTRNKESYLESVDEAFKSAVNRALNSKRSVGLALSGGLDSRAILSASGGRARALETYTLGIQGCADQVIAERLARIAGTKHRFFCLSHEYLRDFLPNMSQMVSMTDGMYVSHGLTEMLALQFLGETSIEVLLRGHGGELAKARLAWPLHTDERVYHLSSLGDLAVYLGERANYITRGLSFSDILLPDAVQAAEDGSCSSFREVLANTELTPAEGCSYLYLRELTRRFTIPSIDLFRTAVEVRLPYLDREFLKVLLAAPSEWRDGTEIHQRLIASGIARLAKVRNSNTGAAANASPKVEFVLDKFNSLFKRLDVRGFRHYHNFDSWMRTMLLQSVESELLATTAKTRGFMKMPVLKELIENTRNGSDDRGYLLQVLLILELWQRENNVDV